MTLTGRIVRKCFSELQHSWRGLTQSGDLLKVFFVYVCVCVCVCVCVFREIEILFIFIHTLINNKLSMVRPVEQMGIVYHHRKNIYNSDWFILL